MLNVLIGRGKGTGRVGRGLRIDLPRISKLRRDTTARMEPKAR